MNTEKAKEVIGKMCGRLTVEQHLEIIMLFGLDEHETATPGWIEWISGIYDYIRDRWCEKVFYRTFGVYMDTVPGSPGSDEHSTRELINEIIDIHDALQDRITRIDSPMEKKGTMNEDRNA